MLPLCQYTPSSIFSNVSCRPLLVRALELQLYFRCRAGVELLLLCVFGCMTSPWQALQHSPGSPVVALAHWSINFQNAVRHFFEFHRGIPRACWASPHSVGNQHFMNSSCFASTYLKWVPLLIRSRAALPLGAAEVACEEGGIGERNIDYTARHEVSNLAAMVYLFEKDIQNGDNVTYLSFANRYQTL
jgi:hypothetical protein